MGTPGRRQDKTEPRATAEAALAPTDIDIQSGDRIHKKEPSTGGPQARFEEEKTRDGAVFGMRATNAPIWEAQTMMIPAGSAAVYYDSIWWLTARCSMPLMEGELYGLE